MEDLPNLPIPSQQMATGAGASGWQRGFWALGWLEAAKEYLEQKSNEDIHIEMEDSKNSAQPLGISRLYKAECLKNTSFCSKNMK